MTCMTLKQSGKEPNGSHLFSTTEKVQSIKIKMLLITFFDIQGTVHYEFVPTGQTVNQVHCLEAVSYTHLHRKYPC